MGDALDITVRRERGAVIAAVTGDVDISTLPGCGSACSSWLTVAVRERPSASVVSRRYEYLRNWGPS